MFDYFTDEPIADARVVARDVNGQAVSPVAISAADGTYSLPVPAARDAEGNVVGDPITLRADAFSYETFPLPPRAAQHGPRHARRPARRAPSAPRTEIRDGFEQMVNFVTDRKY